VQDARVTVDNMVRIAGFSSIALILIGLVVTWVGYVKSVRSAWFIMFIIVVFWAFPGLMLPAFSPGIVMPWRQALVEAITHPGLARAFFKDVAIFVMLAVALVLPVGSFFDAIN